MSWLLPVRDGRAWVGRAVRSGLAECGPDDEFIVVDDGSTDGSAEALPPDRRLRILRQPARGIVAALERGREAAVGDLIARLDCDDVALSGRMAAHRAAMEADPALGAIGGQAVLEHAMGEGMSRYVSWVNGLTDLHTALLIESPLFHPAVTLRAAAVRQVGGYRQGDFPEDYDLWLRLVAAGWRIGSCPVPVVQLQDRPGRLTRSDPRYRRAAFTSLKMEHLAQTRLRQPARVAVWGAGRSGRPWIRWLLSHGHTVPMVVDLFVKTSRQGIPVRPPQDLAQAELDLLLVAVGARGAREEIRKMLSDIRPDLCEGEHWVAVC